MSGRVKDGSALLDYAFEIHQRDGFVCQYCGINGSKSFDTWLTLSEDHLLPRGHLQRDNPDFRVTSCQFCNTAANRYFTLAEEQGLTLDGKTREELVAQRKPYVLATREKYHTFWAENVSGRETP